MMRWRFTVNVTQDDYSGVMALSRKVKTSPSALVQHAIRKMLSEAENALPLIPPAMVQPELDPASVGYGPIPETSEPLAVTDSFFIPTEQRHNSPDDPAQRPVEWVMKLCGRTFAQTTEGTQNPS